MNQVNGDVAGRLAVAIDMVNDVLARGAFTRRSGVFEARGYRAPTTDLAWGDMARVASEHTLLFERVLEDSEAAMQLLNERLLRLQVTLQPERVGEGYQLHFHTSATDFAHG